MKKLTNCIITFLIFVLIVFAIQMITKLVINWVPVLIVGVSMSILFTFATRRITGFVFIGLGIIGLVFSLIMPQAFPPKAIPLFTVALIYGIYMILRSRKQVISEK